MSIDKLELLKKLMTEDSEESKAKKQHPCKKVKTETTKKSQKAPRAKIEKKVPGRHGDAIVIKREVLETIYYLLSGRSIRASKLKVLRRIRDEVDRLITILEGSE